MKRPNLKNPPRPFVMRQWLIGDALRTEIEKILTEVKEKKTTNGFNLEIRLRSCLDLIEERDDLMKYARALELQRGRIRRAQRALATTAAPRADTCKHGAIHCNECGC